MRSRWILNLVLLLTVFLLGWAIRLELAATRIPPTLGGDDTSEPYLIEIARAGEPDIELERLLSGWRMRSPWDVDADPDRVAALLALREAPVLRSMPARAAALDELGLDPVSLRLRLDARDFVFGGTDPVSQLRYVGSEQLVHLIEDRFQHLLIAPPIDYVAPTPLPRGLDPAFGLLDDVPLSGDTLSRLGALVAERVEPAADALTGSTLELRTMEGTRLRYLVSEDGRRWSRPDLGLTYVLPQAPALVEDPDAIDPTPAETLPHPDAAPGVADETQGWLDAAGEGPDSAAPLDPDAPMGQLIDPEAPLSGELPLGPAPEVRLRPFDVLPAAPPESDHDPFEAGPEREPPEGFGLDPFAPDPDVP
ncbi:MAG: DUF4340 domain-containing protein [Thiocapsa sp.]|nr:hypothetical protein [Thiocapsa sp.]MCG6897578.1 DUF4340 domain-containing protein [Thiocapsa sp.]MCG6984761.1 DUF4340 domain-containing protein [Thiocapsa sp.]